MKIALVGPSYPYRGGIAHHTNLFYQYLKARGHDVDVITFIRQYPRFLYPGQFQEESNDGGGFAGQVPSQRMIDSMNPWTWIRTGRELRKRGYDVIVFRWWLPLFGLVFGTIARLAHHKGKRDIVLMLDNLVGHESRLGDQFLTDFIFRYCNFAITQSSEVQKQLSVLYPEIKQTMLPHPVYENFGKAMPIAEARRQLGISATRVILFFGFVRRYKGLDRLLAAMPEIVRRMPDVQLLVVGEFFENPEPYLQQIRFGGVEANVSIHNIYVPNDEVRVWFSAADVLVLPYYSATNSGIVQIGYNFAIPAIVTNVGSLSEVVLDERTGLVLADGEPQTIADAVEKIYQDDRLSRFSENIVNEIEQKNRFSWSAFVEGFEQFVRSAQK